MTELVDIRAADDVRDVTGRAASHLAEGRLVILPTHTGYVLAATPHKAEAVARIAELAGRHPDSGAFLSLRAPVEILDFAPELHAAADRLIRRSWPGPVVVSLPLAGDDGLFGRLSAEARKLLQTDDGVPFLCPADEVHRYVSSSLDTPLLAWAPRLKSGGLVRNAAEMPELAGDAAAFGIDSGPARFDAGATVVRFRGEDVEVTTEGVVSRNAVSRLSSRMIVFVCTGNTCRSPMAEGLFRKILAERLKSEEDRLEERGFMVISAGLSASNGMAAAVEAVEAVRSAGVDISGHLSRPLTDQMIYQADRIYTMTRQHREAIVDSLPDAADRTELLSREGRDVVDPIGQSQEIYDACREQIEEALRAIADELSG